MNCKPLTAGLLATSIALTGCMGDDNDSSAKGADFMAIINTAKYRVGSDVELVDLTDGVYTGELTSDIAGYDNGQDDYAISAYGQHYYRIGRDKIDTITKYSILEPGKPIYTYSTIDKPDDPSSNPYKLVFASETKAFLIRYGSDKIWVVNPSAATEEAFKIGEFNLGHYSDGNGDTDGIPEMSDGVIVNDRLFVTLQRFDWWTPADGNSYVAVININTLQEIDTTPAIPDDLPGIRLKGFNPLSIVYNKNAGLYVQSAGDYGSSPDWMPTHNGGIEKIDLDDYSTTMIVDDGDINNHPYGQITDLVIQNKNLGYFVGSASWQNDTVYQLNPSTGQASTLDTGLAGIGIGSIDAGPEDSLWVSVTGDKPHVLLIDTENNNVIDKVETILEPTGVSFAIK